MAANPTQQPMVIDPDRIPETLCNGRFYLSFQGTGNSVLAVLTFTNIRPEATALFEDRIDDQLIIRARIAMNIPNLVALRDLLVNNVKTETDLTPAGGAAPSAARH